MNTDKQPQTALVFDSVSGIEIFGENALLKDVKAKIYENVLLHTPEELQALKAEWQREVIDLINECEGCIPIDRLFNDDGTHITKKKYGLMLLEIIQQELRQKLPITPTT